MKLFSALLVLAGITAAAATVDLCCTTIVHSGEDLFQVILKELGLPPDDDPDSIGVGCDLPNPWYATFLLLLPPGDDPDSIGVGCDLLNSCLRSPSNLPHRSYHPPDPRWTPPSPELHPCTTRTSLTSTAPCATAHESGTNQPIAGILGFVSSSHTREVTNTRTQASSDPVSILPNHSKPTQMRPDASPDQ
ncbi:hypothetical protein B0H13DRAFT_2350323 [Mycena leptocephala]|nr:hypothetical protein B0H13DRAFT_2350320 [Mycena leptocephala]KAJ7870549.1 hypothetical protein B0H13DRAFT_2350323 [Mycena leptocephala]